MQLEAILERNRQFVRDRQARPLPPPETIRLAVVACYDPRLDVMLPEALGLRPGDAFLLRTAGALLQPGGTTLRSVGLAVFMFGVTEIMVLGHTSCRMATFGSASFIDSFRKRGVPREAFGNDDLRVWAGAIPDPRRGVAISVANLLAAPFLPEDVSVAGVVLDDTTGALDVVVKPGEGVPVSTVVVETAETALPRSVSSAQEKATPVTGSASPVPRGTVGPPTGAHTAVDPLAEAVRGLVRSLEASQHWRDEIPRLRQELASRKEPLAKLGLLEAVARRAGAQSKEVREAFARVQREASTPGRLRGPQELIQLFQELSGRA